VLRIGVSALLEFIVVPLKIFGVEELRHHAAEIVGGKVGGLTVTKVELGEPFPSPNRSRGAVVNER
jgi:hypothetical protein